jgi:hypothetical protein
MYSILIQKSGFTGGEVLISEITFQTQARRMVKNPHRMRRKLTCRLKEKNSFFLYPTKHSIKPQAWMIINNICTPVIIIGSVVKLTIELT